MSHTLEDIEEFEEQRAAYQRKAYEEKDSRDYAMREVFATGEHTVQEIADAAGISASSAYTIVQDRLCVITGCPNRVKAKGLCNKHYTQLRRGG